MADGKFTLRTRTGVATQTGIKKETVDKIVDELKAEGLVNSVQILRKGQPKTRWYITPEGRSVLGSPGQSGQSGELLSSGARISLENLTQIRGVIVILILTDISRVK
jgi:predicted ArsR family transcriptional regulator